MKAILAGSLIDAKGVRDDPVVLVNDNIILDVGEKGRVKIPGDAEVFEVPDMFLMPGLIDCHVHFTGSDESTPGLLKGSFESRLINAAVNQTRRLLDNGITSVMDTGGLIGASCSRCLGEGFC